MKFTVSELSLCLQYQMELKEILAQLFKNNPKLIDIYGLLNILTVCQIGILNQLIKENKAVDEALLEIKNYQFNCAQQIEYCDYENTLLMFDFEKLILKKYSEKPNKPSSPILNYPHKSFLHPPCQLFNNKKKLSPNLPNLEKLEPVADALEHSPTLFINSKKPNKKKSHHQHPKLVQKNSKAKKNIYKKTNSRNISHLKKEIGILFEQNKQLIHEIKSLKKTLERFQSEKNEDSLSCYLH